mgnify:CR=1 FL=1
MVRDLLLNVVSKWRISDIILLSLLIFTFMVSWFITLSLGLRILNVKVKFKRIIPGVLIGTFIAAFIRPFTPGALAFFSFSVPLLVCLKCYSKAKWIVTSWATFLLLLSTAIFPIIVSPLLSSNHLLSVFFTQNIYSLPINVILETLCVALLLVFLTIFDISLIPSSTPLLTTIDFYDVYLFLAICFWCFLSVSDIWKNLMHFSIWSFFICIVSVTAFVAFFLRKMNEKRKLQEYQKNEEEYQRKLEAKDNQIQELTELAIKNQQNNKTKTNAPRPDLENRERKIIKSIIEGKSNNEIASEVYVSDGRIGNLITSIYRKLGVKNRVQLITYIVKNNLLEWICED